VTYKKETIMGRKNELKIARDYDRVTALTAFFSAGQGKAET